MHRIWFMLASACLLAVRPLHAQANPDTMASFRSGQWGVEFIPSRSLAEGGVLRFSTPTLAWVLDGSATFDHETMTCDCSPDQSGESFSANARIGPRWYHDEYERVVRFVGLGLTGSYSRGSQSSPGPSNQEYWSAGAYGELGVQYLFTRHLGLGVRGDVVGSRTSQHFTQQAQVGSTTQYVTTYRLALEPLQIIGTFYF